jgi:proteasome lid subunit RPN8/RPN11
MTTLKALPKRIQISKDMRMSIEKHAYSNLTAEVGGMLFGEITGGKTQVVGSIPATSAAAEQISLTFTHEVWEQILAEGNKLFPGKQIVGWYHTHPSFGLFMSDYDQFIQKNFFQNPGQIGLVIDPIAGNQGWFEVNAKGDVVQFATEETFTGPKAAPQLKTVEKSSKGKVFGALVGGVVLGAALGWGIFALTNHDVPAETYAAAQTQLAQNQQDFAQEQDSLKALCNETNRLRIATSGGKIKELGDCYVSHEGDTWETLSSGIIGNGSAVALLKSVNPQVTTDAIPAGTVVSLPSQAAFIALLTPQPTATPAPTATPTPTVTPAAKATTAPSAKPTPQPTSSSNK